jgi:Protein of unknown function (DUF2927)
MRRTFENSAKLNIYQASKRSDKLQRLPLVYGVDVFVKDPFVLSHKTSVTNGHLQHECIAAVSRGQYSSDSGGYIGKFDKYLYANGVRLSGDSIVESRSGVVASPVYTMHSMIYRSFEISGTAITLPSKLQDGSAVLSGTAFYLQNGSWLGFSLSPNVPVILPFPGLWISVETNTPAIFPSVATVLTRVISDAQSFKHPDVYVREGRVINRIIGAGRGNYQPEPSHIISGSNSYLVNVLLGTEYELPLSNTTPVNFQFDEDWIVVKRGVSDRFPDVIADLISSALNGEGTTSNLSAMIDYQSFVTANAHTDSLGLKVSAAIKDQISITDFVNDNALFFDLLSMRDRNRMALIPHTVNDAYVMGLFTTFNCSDMALVYDSSRNTEYSSVFTYTHDEKRNWDLAASSDGYTVNPIVLNGSDVIQSDLTFKLQENRILDSCNKQDRHVELIAPAGYQQLRSGDFILVASDDWDDLRAHNGGLTATNITDVFACSLDNVYTAFSTSSTTANKITVDFSNRKDSYSGINFKVNDILVIKVGSDSIIHARITDVIDSADNSVVIFERVEFSDSNSDWIKKSGDITIPEDSIVVHYKIGGYSGFCYFYDDLGIPRKSGVRLFGKPQRNERLSIFVKLLNYDGYVADTTPIIFERDNLLWRISSIEPLQYGNLLIGRESRDNSQVRKNDGYRVVATVYPFADPKVYPGLKRPPTTTIDVPLSNVIEPASDAIKAYLLELAIGNEFAGSDNTVHKWQPGAITISVSGAGAEDLTTVNVVIDELQILTGRTINLVPTGGSISLTFAKELDFGSLDATYTPKNLGYFSATLNQTTKDIVSGIALVDTSETTQIERDHLVREELTQLICGLPNDSYTYSDSMFQQSWTTTQAFSAIDQSVIKLMNNPAITSGMTITQLKAVLTAL